MYLKVLLILVSGIFLLITLQGKYLLFVIKESSGKSKIFVYKFWLITSFLSLGVLGTWVIYYLGLLKGRVNGEGTSTIYHPYDLTLGVVNQYINIDASLICPVLFGFCIGIIVIFIVARTRRGRKFYNTETISTLGSTSNTETAYLTLLCINAGISEEIMFRGALPSLLFAVTHNAPASLTVSCVVFGCMHWYQGARGVISTFFMALLFSAILMVGLGLYVVMFLHFFFNIAALLLIPKAFDTGRPNTVT